MDIKPLDQATLATLQSNYAASAPMMMQRSQAPQQKKKPKQQGRGGTLTSLISEGGALGGAAAGAAAGSVVPVVGTAIGGILGAGLGAFAGRVAENKVRDNRVGLGDAAKEGALSAVLSGPLKLAKYGATAAKSAKGGASLEDALVNAATNSSAKTGVAGVLPSKIRTAAGDRSAAGFGNQVGATVNGQTVTPDAADALQKFITKGAQKYGGIPAGNPMTQARAAQAVHNNVIGALDNALANINRGVAKNELTAIADNAALKVADSGAVTGSTNTLGKFADKIAKAKDLKQLEAIRREADNIGFTQRGAGKTSASFQAQAVRDAIDEFITPLSKDYKAIKSDYAMSKQALDSTSKAAKNPKGIPLPFTAGGISGGVTVGGNPVSSVRNKVNATLAGTTGPGNPVSTGARMGAQGGLAESIFNAQNTQQETNLPDTSSVDMGFTPDMNLLDQQGADLALSEPQSQNPYSKDALLYDIQRDPKNADKYIEYFSNLEAIFNPSTSEKPLSAESSKIISNANIGLQALNDFEGAVAQDPSVLAKRVIPGRGLLGGAVGGALGTRGVDAASQQIIDVIARLRTGAAITNDEARRFEQFIPQAGDNPSVRAQKLNYLRSQFQAVANRTGGSSTSLEDALLAQQGGY